MTRSSDEQWSDRLLRLGLVVQAEIVQLQREHGGFDRLAEPTREAAGDRIYAIDDFVEGAITEHIRTWPAECFPLDLIAEGFGDDGHLRFGEIGVAPRFRLIVDPIDGTRMLMYDKRSAWFLAAVTDGRAQPGCLSECLASVSVELPTSKQHLADAFVAVSGQQTRGLRVDLAASRIGETTPSLVETVCSTATEFAVTPSSKTTLRDGFVSVVSYFPGIKQLAAELTERIAAADPQLAEAPNMFDDQYISTGGQLVQLMTGRDRCCVDLRPLMAQMKGVKGPVMSAHPYDLAGLLAAQQAGVIVTNGFGETLRAPLDVTTAVHWCGYANATIQLLVQPIIQTWLEEKGC